MGKPGRRRKRKTHVTEESDPDTPRIIVIRRGVVRPELKQLVKDLRVLFSPNCATNLNEGSRQKMKDFTGVSEALGLTHMVVISETKSGCYLKIASFPKGPTLTFSIDLLTLVSDIAKHTFNPKSIGGKSNYSPLVVLNGFGASDEHTGTSAGGEQFSAVKTMSTTFNKMFSPIDVSTTKMQSCKRVVLFNKERDTNTIVMRHYLISLVDCNTSGAVRDLIDKRSIKRLMNEKNSSFKDLMKEFNMNTGKRSNLREDYVELNNVDPGDMLLRHKYGLKISSELKEISEGNNRMAVSLTEAGPRLNLRLIKIEEGVFNGAVKFHNYVNKTPEEIEQLEAASREKRRLEQESSNSKKAKTEDEPSEQEDSDGSE